MRHAFSHTSIRNHSTDSQSPGTGGYSAQRAENGSHRRRWGCETEWTSAFNISHDGHNPQRAENMQVNSWAITTARCLIEGKDIGECVCMHVRCFRHGK